MFCADDRAEVTYSHLLWSPNIEIYGLDLADMRSHGSMNTGAPNAQEDTAISFFGQINSSMDGDWSHMFQEAQRGSSSKVSTGASSISPERTIAFAIRTDLVLRPLQQLSQCSCMPFCRSLVLSRTHVQSGDEGHVEGAVDGARCEAARDGSASRALFVAVIRWLILHVSLLPYALRPLHSQHVFRRSKSRGPQESHSGPWGRPSRKAHVLSPRRGRLYVPARWYVYIAGSVASLCLMRLHYADPPLAPLPTNRPTLESFVGEETNMPRPTPTSTAAAPQPAPKPQAPGAPSRAGTQPTPAQEEQMRAFREALAAAAGGSFPSSSQPDVGEDPLAALMASMGQPGGMPSMPQQKVAASKPKTRLQKLLPFIHLIAAWILLMYFVLRREPEAFESRTHHAPSENLWRRWAELAWESPGDGWGVQPVVSCSSRVPRQ